MNAIQTLLTENIGIWTAADAEKKSGRGRASSNATSVYGIRKLRELILELAVRGKLVPQDANDEPASSLIKRIQAEKAKLIVEGQIRKEKPLPPVSAVEELDALPRGWVQVRLGDIAYSQAGFAFKSNGFNESGVGLPLIRIRDVGQVFTGTYFDGEYRDEFVVRRSDYLVSMDGEFRVAKWLNGDALLNQRVSRLIFLGSELAQRFIAEALQARLRELQGVKAYTTVDHLSGGQISNSVIALPPVSEQYRIVAKVDELMALCDQLETQHNNAAEAHEKIVSHLLGTLTQSQNAEDFSANWQRIAAHFDTLFTTEASIDALKQTLLQLAVMGKLVPQDPNEEPAYELLKCIRAEKAKLVAEGKIKKDKPLARIPDDEKPFDLPQEWKWARIGEVVLSTDYGLSEKTLDLSEGVPVLKMGDIQDGEVVLGGQKKVRRNVEGLPELYLKSGDLLYNRTNSAELVGKTGIYEGLEGAYTFASYLIRIRCVDGLVFPHYLNFVMNSPLFRETQIEPYLKQQCGQANVNGTIMRSMIVSVPPINEQMRIVVKVNELTALCEQLKTRITQANQLQQKLADVVVEQAT